MGVNVVMLGFIKIVFFAFIMAYAMWQLGKKTYVNRHGKPCRRISKISFQYVAMILSTIYVLVIVKSDLERLEPVIRKMLGGIGDSDAIPLAQTLLLIAFVVVWVLLTYVLYVASVKSGNIVYRRIETTGSAVKAAR